MIRCPVCNSPDTRVKDVFNQRREDCIVRYRTCKTCACDFPTHEKAVKYRGNGRHAIVIPEGGDE